MQKLFVAALAATPSVVLAHPDHSNSTYSLIHYVSGSHLVTPLLIGVGFVVCVLAAKRYLSK